MIKIQLTDSTKKKIEDIFIKDMQKQSTGLFQVLQRDKVKLLLEERYEFLYNIFYDDTGKVLKENVKEFLLSDRQKMKELMIKSPTVNEKDSKILQNEIFRYDTFSKRNSAYEILEKLQVNVCPYCNRQYTFTLVGDSVRPQFDHYYPKSKYPYLAISLYNLIPCCGICNLAKETLDTLKKPILYPYEEEFGEEIKFVVQEDTLRAMQGFSDEFSIKIKATFTEDNELMKKINTQVEELKLERLYNKHKDYIQDLVKNSYINSQERIDELLKKFPGLYNSKEEMQRVLMMNYVEKEDWGKRPLAKLTADIYNSV